MEGKYLITTDNWFVTPTGVQAKAVWGNVEILEDSLLGVKTNRNSTNWYAKVGSNENHVIIAGCQIHQACRCEKKPNTNRCEDWTTQGEKVIEYERPTMIYIAE